MRILILGVTGMLGNAVFKTFSADSRYEMWGTLRNEKKRGFFSPADNARLISGIDVLNQQALIAVMNRTRPEVIINCVGLIKQLDSVNDPLIALPINAMFPHQLASLCGLLGARLIHLSSDCVYAGLKGNYLEADPTDAEDLYGKSKAIGELQNYPHAITLRTSGIGHELDSRFGLLEWFLSQQGQVKGYKKAIYSGLPSRELARVIKDHVLPHPELHGLYHVSAKPIAKLDLLKLVAKIYSKEIRIVPDETLVVERSLNSERFTRATGYVAADWPELIQSMHDSR